MPRTARQVSSTGFYHVLARGHNRKEIFRDAADYRSYLAALARFKKDFPCKLYHFCLMPNHVHLLTATSKIQFLTAMMRRIQQSYQLHWRHRYNLVGNLWQGRFKSIPIEEESYLLECARYIERNPVRAELCERPENYPWSSAPFYFSGGEDYSEFLDMSPAFLGFGPGRGARRRRYRTFVGTQRAYDRLVDEQLDDLE